MAMYRTILFLCAALVCGQESAAQHIDEKAQAKVIDDVLSRLQRDYVFPELATQMATAVRAAQQSGRYDRVSEAKAFAEALTSDLRSVSKDLHLRVYHRSSPPRIEGGGPSGAPGAQVVTRQILPDNIGYIRLDRIPVRDRLAPVLDPIMKEIAHTRALIIDLRENPGGSPEGVTYVAGYLLKESTLLARIYSRPSNDTTEMWSDESVPGPRYTDQPVYILTSRRTFSAAEAVAYHLKHLGRAVVVGDSTGGGAHRINGAELSHGFVLSVPHTRPINPRTGTDWEGVGVIPDIAVPAERALEAALSAIGRR